MESTDIEELPTKDIFEKQTRKSTEELKSHGLFIDQEKNPSEISDVPQILVPADGNCFFISILLSYLLCVIDDHEEFCNRLHKITNLTSEVKSKLREGLIENHRNIEYLRTDPNLVFLIDTFKEKLEISGWGGNPEDILKVQRLLNIKIVEVIEMDEDVTHYDTKEKEEADEIRVYILRCTPSDHETSSLNDDEALQQGKFASVASSGEHRHFRVYDFDKKIDAAILRSQNILKTARGQSTPHSSVETQNIPQKKPNLEQMRDSFDIHADDSSDEETVSGNMEAYDVEAKWQEYAASRKTLAEKDASTKLGFVVHAYGLKLLYSPGTNAAYYPLKKERLGKNQFYNEINWFRFALEQVFDETKKNFSLSVSFQDYLRRYNDSLENNWTPQLKKLKRPLLLWLQGKPQTNELAELLKEVFQSYYQFFSSFCPGREGEVLQQFVAREACPQDVKRAIALIQQELTYKDPQVLSGSYTSIDLEARRTLEAYALDQAISYLQDLGALKSNTQPVKKSDRQKVQFIDNAKYPQLGIEVKRWYTDKNLDTSSRLRGDEKKLGAWEKPHKIKALAIALILDFTETPIAQINIGEQAYQEFVSLFAKHLSSSRSNPLYRPTIERSLLPSTFTLQSPSPYAFFANLRLSQRDMKRRQNQLLDDRNNKDEVLIGSSYSRAWKFKSSVEALETQELTANQTTKMFSRNDKIINFGNYAEISSEMSALTSMINCSLIITNAAGLPRTSEQMITDAKIAAWVRKTLQGHNIAEELVGYRLLPGHLKKLETFIVNLTQLLFGCEGSRNPASFILHQMVLDLVIYANYPWNQMFCETLGQNQFNQPQTNIRLMPMAMKKAVPSSRILHNKFMNFMPHPYQYFGSEQDEKSYDLLKTRYPMLINTWLTYYLKNPQENLEQAIEHSLERWYGISALHLGFNKK